MFCDGTRLYAPRILGDIMAGHSQYKNIMHRKGRQDKLRSNAFAKLGREITVATKAGLPDPAMNARLRLAVQNARAGNMPWDTIERAIKKASGADGESVKTAQRKCHNPETPVQEPSIESTSSPRPVSWRHSGIHDHRPRPSESNDQLSDHEEGGCS